MYDDIYMLWLSSKVAQIGSRKLNSLLETFQNARNIFDASPRELQAAFLTPNAVNALTTNRSLRYIESMLEEMAEKGAVYFSRNNPRFPTLLSNIPDPPIGIFFIGTMPSDNSNKVAIIGSRHCSEYGKMAAGSMAESLAKSGIVIVSGMAYGIDSMAHKGALKGGGLTMAVLGCGVDICYPESNRRLREEIIANGCVISEYPLKTTPEKYFFPARNRIISGLSLGVVVAEAGRKSGTLITVNQAMDQGREIMAVPGSIYSKLCQGTNELIRDGAYPVADYTDILHTLKIEPEKQADTKKIKKEEKIYLAPNEKQVYDNLASEAISFDMLLNLTGINPNELHMICMKLEIHGLAKKLPGQRYIKGH